MSVSTEIVEIAADLFRKRGGILRTKDAISLGIHPRTLYQMRDSGIIDRLSRGVYRLGDLPPLTDPDLVTVATKIPDGVICLISALAYHQITTQIPHEVYVALKAHSITPRLSHPPMRIFWFTPTAFTAGVETHKIDSVKVRLYSVEKTLADCFKYRNKIGMDTVLEALTLYRDRKKPRLKQLMEYARICRVEKVMRPYVEAKL